jgi:hypothetical protein
MLPFRYSHARPKRIIAAPLLLLLGSLAATPAVAQVRERPMPNAPVAAETTGPDQKNIDVAPAPPIEMSPEAKPAAYKRDLFGPDPDYSDVKYDPAEQLKVYGNKHPVPTQRPVIEWGYPLYDAGPLPAGIPLPFGEKDLMRPQLLVYGDWRTAVAWNDLGKASTAQVATRLNLDVNLQLTGTERFHAFFQPLQQNGTFTHWQFAGNNNGPNKVVNDLNANIQTLFFEGDAGAILAGLTNEYQTFDLPFGVGKMPLFFQNGIWFNDAPIGGAFTIPSKNSPLLDISNMDITFFAEGDNVASNAIKTPAGALDIHAARLWGFHTEIERHEAYIEFGYGYTEDTRPNSGFSYSNITAAITKRYWHTLSNSIRIIGNFGQNPDNGAKKTADGYVILVENSLITPLPSTFVPYFNGWFGRGNPQALARDPGTGNILLNTGINFETDGLTGFPKLDDTANNTFGGAIGLEYLFDLQQQIVGEIATVQTMDNPANRVAKGAEYAVGLRYQIPLTEQFIFRADGMLARLINAKNVAGIRTEFRWKF